MSLRWTPIQGAAGDVRILRESTIFSRGLNVEVSSLLGMTTNQAATTGQTTSQLAQLQTAFSGGLGQLTTFLGASPFRGFSVAQGAVTAQTQTTAGTPSETDVYNTGVLVSGSASTAAAATGVAAGLRAMGRADGLTVLAMAGDGGTGDIGIQALSGAAERNDDFIYLCYDNEAYMNTGTQRSSHTPRGARTTTTWGGKREHAKDVAVRCAKRFLDRQPGDFRRRKIVGRTPPPLVMTRIPFSTITGRISFISGTRSLAYPRAGFFNFCFCMMDMVTSAR